MILRLSALVLCLLGAAAVLPAQLVGPGFNWSGSSGGYAGAWVPSCANLPVDAVRGETVTLRIWGDRSAPYALFGSAGGSQCLPIPGIRNALVLDFPVLALGAGVLTQPSPCLICPPFYAELRFTVPAAVPPGAALSLQAATYGGLALSFTVAITGTVR